MGGFTGGDGWVRDQGVETRRFTGEMGGFTGGDGWV